ncbi:hypothetical protein ACVS9P_00735 [Caproicibacterium sp. NSD3]
MNGDAELLNFIYQNSQMGVETLGQLIPMVKNSSEFQKQLEGQKREYDSIHKEARELLESHGKEEKGLGSFEKVRTYLMVNLETLTDRSASHIAEMLVIGSNMGVIDAIKNLKKYESGVSPEVKSLMERLRKFEENNMERLKKYLS